MALLLGPALGALTGGSRARVEMRPRKIARMRRQAFGFVPTGPVIPPVGPIGPVGAGLPGSLLGPGLGLGVPPPIAPTIAGYGGYGYGCGGGPYGYF